MNEPLRVLTFLHSLEPGGVERDVLRFTKAWRGRGVDARIVLGRREGALLGEAPDVPYFVLQNSRAPTARFEDMHMIRRLPGIIREFRPDVLLIASNNHALIALATRLVLGRRCPPIVMRVSMDLTRADMHPLADQIDKRVFRLYRGIFASVVAMAPPLQTQILQHLRIAPTRVVTIANGSMTHSDIARITQARAELVRESVGRHFLGIGRLMPQKNFALLIRAFASIARPLDRLTIVGEGAQRDNLEALARALNVDKQVELPGHHMDILPWLAEADAFILSSDFEGLPAVMIEALAAGLPIVATRCATSIPMLVEDAGELVPIRDCAALATAMDRICDMPVDAEALRARASQFTIDATVDQWVALFERVSARRVH